MTKPATSLLLVMCSSLYLAACGGGSGGGSESVQGGLSAVSSAPAVSTAEAFPGGDTSVADATSDAFDFDAANLSAIDTLEFEVGDGLFNNPHSDDGPLLNGASCLGCHIRDSKGVVPNDTTTPLSSLIFFSSIPGATSDGAPLPDPIYGSQIQTFGPSGALSVFEGSLDGSTLIGEAFPFIEFEEVDGQFSDGTPYTLRQPVYKLRDISYGDFAEGIMFSPRLAQSVNGVGLLEAITDVDILAQQDPDDSDGDGISGRANLVFDVENPTEPRLGRFGWKANVPTLLQQTAVAFTNDSGVTNSRFPQEPCTPTQIGCSMVAVAESVLPNASDVDLARVEFYIRVLGVPQRRGFNSATQTFDEDVLRGRELFFDAGCNGCHTQQYTTGFAAGSVLGRVVANSLVTPAPEVEAISNQTIFPYTDMLLHDMGGQCQPIARETADGVSCSVFDNSCLWVQRCDGLADGRDDFLASGSEWRTPPLWSLGLIQTISENATFLHDGRARTIEEAILWHGDEASEARAAWQAFIDMSATERADLLTFLESL